MSVCLTLGASVLGIAASTFTLSWTHSVERSEWRERWTLLDDGMLQLREARVRGSGAGMDPGAGARLVNGWWIWQPTLPAVPSLVLALSGATGEGWTLCGDDRCREIGRGSMRGGEGGEAPRIDTSHEAANAGADHVADTGIVSACDAPPLP